MRHCLNDVCPLGQFLFITWTKLPLLRLQIFVQYSEQKCPESQRQHRSKSSENFHQSLSDIYASFTAPFWTGFSDFSDFHIVSSIVFIPPLDLRSPLTASTFPLLVSSSMSKYLSISFCGTSFAV